MKFVFHRVENSAGKGENGWDEHCLLFTKCLMFSKPFFLKGLLKSGLCEKGLTVIYNFLLDTFKTNL